MLKNKFKSYLILLALISSLTFLFVLPASACHCPATDDWGQVELEAVNYGADIWKMVATASVDPSHPDASDITIKSVTFYWYGPFADETTSPPYAANYTTTDTSAPFISEYDPIGEDDLGWWLVEADFTGYLFGWSHMDCESSASATLDLISEVPWFTSLPLVMITSVGLVYFFKKKKVSI